ncbi:MAG: MarR family transcriptional regulator [Thermoproteota archaeon]
MLKRPSGIWLFLILASGTALIAKLLSPSVVQVVVTDDIVHVYQIPNVYTTGDVLSICLFSAALGISAYRGFTGERILLAKGVGKDVIVTLLKEDEMRVYKLIEGSGPISQAEIARVTGFSKSKLSGVLDVLEAYGLITRRRRGRENIISCSET